ncbi:hypothetical protein [Microbacterium cremeum]|uniref:hypothetical protein n=1 Tax=Microbacterium cremeum TaxID=2782169 RepID=UPI00188888DD|nr:hypothetical protein [Microbacterium cremeum]
MDARTGLVIGGMATVAASVAVVCVVALTTPAALADSPGSNVASARVLVPAGASTSPEVAAPVAEAAPEAVVVEAPEPAVVEPASSDDAARVTPPPVSSVTPAEPATPPNAKAAVEASVKAGSWDAVIAWALAHGWSQERIDEWIDRLETERTAASEGGRPGEEQQAPPAPPAPGLVAPDPTPERPANAGSTADRTESSDSSRGGAKKDRSRDSPDRRDR